MEYLPDVYQHFEHAFPQVHSVHQDLAKACYTGGSAGLRVTAGWTRGLDDALAELGALQPGVRACLCMATALVCSSPSPPRSSMR